MKKEKIARIYVSYLPFSTDLKRRDDDFIEHILMETARNFGGATVFKAFGSYFDTGKTYIDNTFVIEIIMFDPITYNKIREYAQFLKTRFGQVSVLITYTDSEVEFI